MTYVYSKKLGTITEYSDEENISLGKSDIIVTEDEAYVYLFWNVSKSLAIKFNNYRNLDIQSELMWYMLDRYKRKGTWAPDRPFSENELMWRSAGKKRALYLIRKERTRMKHTVYNDEIKNFTTVEIEDIDCTPEITDYIHKLANSQLYTESQLGLYGMAKEHGLTDEQIMNILEIKYSRLKEIKRELRELLYNRFGELL